MSGNCNEDCEDFLNGNCSEGYEMLCNMPEHTITTLYYEYQDPFKAICLKIVKPEFNKFTFLVKEFGYEK